MPPPYSRASRFGRGAARMAALLCALLVVAAPTRAHEIKGWWKYDPAYWRHDFRAHQDLRQVHRHWHEGHARPRNPGGRLDRWKRHHATLHHLDLDHRHQAMHHHDTLARQGGEATWYDLEGAGGSCGEPLHGMYAAHPKWPCGTLVSVRTADRYVFVRVMDRGPFGDGRVIDLSRRAFDKLRPASKGIADVKIYRLEP
jgi:rare lipoprotein A (peptidoglycan hydrolase)